MDDAEANVVGIFIRTFFYGIYLLLTAHSFRWIFFEDEGWLLRPRINGAMLTVVVLVFLLTTSNLGVWITSTLAAVRGTPLPPDRFTLVPITLENATTLMIDALLIFRCWVVSNRSWLHICFPLLLWLANIGLLVTWAYETAINVINPPIFMAFYSCNVAINLYAISMIIYQILRVARRRHSGGPGSDLYDICRILIECALPYLLSTLFILAVFTIRTKSFLNPTGCALNSTMSAIAFNLLVIRVGLRRTDDKQDNNPASSIRFNAAINAMLEDQTSEKGTQEAV